MKRLLHSTFAIAAALSLALGVGLAGLWVYSHWRPMLRMRVGDDRVFRVVVVDGTLAIERVVFVWDRPYRANPNAVWMQELTPRQPNPDQLDPANTLKQYRANSSALLNGNFFLGEPIGSGDVPDTMPPADGKYREREYDIAQAHLGVLVELAAILPAIWLASIWKRRQRCPPGQCVPCGNVAGKPRLCVICGRVLPGSPKRRRQIVLKTLTIFSAILGLIVGQLWLRSFLVCEQYLWSSSNYVWMLDSNCGRLCLMRESFVLPDFQFLSWGLTDYIGTPATIPIPHWIGSERTDLGEIYGIGGSTRTTVYAHLRKVYFPYWLVFLPTAIVPLLALRSAWRRRRIVRRFAGGLCWNCGYDLRATPERCPECGLTTPTRYNARP